MANTLSVPTPAGFCAAVRQCIEAVCRLSVSTMDRRNGCGLCSWRDLCVGAGAQAKMAVYSGRYCDCFIHCNSGGKYLRRPGAVVGSAESAFHISVVSQHDKIPRIA